MRWTSRTISGIFLAIIGLLTVILGIAFGGGPGYARAQHRDELRSQGMSNIRNVAEGLYTWNGRIPTAEELHARILSMNASTVYFPEGHPFFNNLPEYMQTNEKTYQLCTTFETNTLHLTYGEAASTIPVPEEYPNFWNHLAGRTCFSIAIPQEVIRQRQLTTSSTQP